MASVWKLLDMPWLWRTPLAVALLVCAALLIDKSREAPSEIGGLIQAGDWLVTTESGAFFRARAWNWKTGATRYGPRLSPEQSWRFTVNFDARTGWEGKRPIAQGGYWRGSDLCLVDLGTLTATPVDIQLPNGERRPNAWEEFGYEILGHCSKRRYVALWNEHDPVARLRLIDTATGRQTDQVERVELPPDTVKYWNGDGSAPLASRRAFDVREIEPDGCMAESDAEELDDSDEPKVVPLDEDLAWTGMPPSLVFEGTFEGGKIQIESRPRRTIPWMSSVDGRFELRMNLDWGTRFVRYERSACEAKPLDKEDLLSRHPDEFDSIHDVLAFRTDVGDVYVQRHPRTLERIDPDTASHTKLAEPRRWAWYVPEREDYRMLAYPGTLNSLCGNGMYFEEWTDAFVLEDGIHAATIDGGGTIRVFDSATGATVATDHRELRRLRFVFGLRCLLVALVAVMIAIGLRRTGGPWAWFDGAAACVVVMAVSWTHRYGWRACDALSPYVDTYPQAQRFPYGLYVDPRVALPAAILLVCWARMAFRWRILAIAALVAAVWTIDRSAVRGWLAVNLAGVAALGVATRWTGVAVEPPDDVKPTATTWQWGVADLVALTSAIAIVITACRPVDSPFALDEWFSSYRFDWSLFARTLVFAPLVCWGVFSRSWVRATIAVLVGSAAFLALGWIDFPTINSLGYGRELWSFEETARWAKIALDGVATAILILLPFWLRGYRWTWRAWGRKIEGPVETPATS